VFMISHYIPLRMRYIQTKFAERKKDVLYSQIFSPENRAVYEKMWKNMVGPDRPHVTLHIEHAHCMMDNYVYKHTLIVCNTYCFSTATMITRRLPNVTFTRTVSVLLICVCVCECDCLNSRYNCQGCPSNILMKSVSSKTLTLSVN
jgi:hypothetical protein